MSDRGIKPVGRGSELAALRASIKRRTATLVTATREIELSHAAVLRELLGVPKP